MPDENKPASRRAARELERDLTARGHARPEALRDSGYISKSELRERGRAVRPRDAATLIIVRPDGTEPRVLLGKRSAGHKFMPNKFVFPGGKVDRADSRIRPPHDLHPEVMRRLRRGCSESKARALALAAIRETYEETGLIIGEPDSPTLRSRSASWGDFLQHDVNPRLDVLHYVARAITPPYRNRRFDARFFMVEARHIQGEVHERPSGSGELLDLHWIELSKAREMEQLPHITRAVLREVARRLDEGHGQEVEGPFVYTRHGRSVVDSA
ncbi:MAG: NUDIX domain-containing protein [Halioglobus sp.]|nr:NUDIX domain-containing protein [Halioglobus sp.]